VLVNSRIPVPARSTHAVSTWVTNQGAS
jgi:hypothetical protein